MHLAAHQAHRRPYKHMHARCHPLRDPESGRTPRLPSLHRKRVFSVINGLLLSVLCPSLRGARERRSRLLDSAVFYPTEDRAAGYARKLPCQGVLYFTSRSSTVTQWVSRRHATPRHAPAHVTPCLPRPVATSSSPVGTDATGPPFMALIIRLQADLSRLER